MPAPSIARRTRSSWRGLATRLSTTPAIAHAFAKIAQAGRDRRRGLCLAGGIEHQQHRPAHHLRKIRRWRRCRTCPASRRHRTGPSSPRPAPDRRRRRVPSSWSMVVARHRPAIEIDRGAPGRRGVKGGIDVIRAALEALHGKPAIAEGARQRQGQRGLAGAGGGCGDDEAARHHDASGKRGEVPTGR